MSARREWSGHPSTRIMLMLLGWTAAAGAATVYVSPAGSNTPPYTNWTTAAHAIQTAINAAAHGDTVRVGPATYSLTAAVVVDRGVVLVGDLGAPSTILHGSGTTNCIRMAHTGAVLRGFTVRNGRAYNGGGVFMGNAGMVEECTITNNYAHFNGGGLYLTTNGLVRSCTVISNRANHYGGGICLYGGGRVEDTTVALNGSQYYGGGLYLEDGGSLKRLHVTGNRADWGEGGGLYGEYPGDIEDSTFLTNETTYSGGGMYLWAGTVRRCRLLGNRADEDGGGIAAHQADLESCLIAGNRAGRYGGGVYSEYAPMRNLTVVANETQTGDGGGIFANTSAALRDSIVTGNTAPWNPNLYGASPEYCCIDPPPAGTGNFAGPACFVNPASGDYRLATNSSCLDAGSPSGFPTLDVDGVPRGLDGNNDGIARNDVGAHEFLHAAADSDGDGLTDEAEIAVYHTDPADPDCDDDGQDDRTETVAGTDPNNPASWFGLTPDTTDPVAGLVLEWTSYTGRLYTVVSATSLVAGDWTSAPGGTDLPGTGGWMSYSYGPSGTSRFVRLLVRLAP